MHLWKHCSFNFYSFSLLQTCFIAIASFIFSYSKHSNKSFFFFNVYTYIWTLFTTTLFFLFIENNTFFFRLNVKNNLNSFMLCFMMPALWYGLQDVSDPDRRSRKHFSVPIYGGIFDSFEWFFSFGACSFPSVECWCDNICCLILPFMKIFQTYMSFDVVSNEKKRRKLKLICFFNCFYVVVVLLGCFHLKYFHFKKRIEKNNCSLTILYSFFLYNIYLFRFFFFSFVLEW